MQLIHVFVVVKKVYIFSLNEYHGFFLVESFLIPYSFVWRRLHSALGIFLVVYLIEHLYTNVKSVFDPIWFVDSVNQIHSIPYLYLVEFFLIALPFFLHMFWGIFIVKEALPNSFPTDGTTASLTQYEKNYAYTWQRITSWIFWWLF